MIPGLFPLLRKRKPFVFDFTDQIGSIDPWGNACDRGGWPMNSWQHLRWAEQVRQQSRIERPKEE